MSVIAKMTVSISPLRMSFRSSSRVNRPGAEELIFVSSIQQWWQW
jgi:hypothetical protein